MLTKIDSRYIREPDGRLRRDWYQESAADVVLVHDASTGRFLSFEIEWDERGRSGRAYVVWRREEGLRTGRLDGGEAGAALSFKAALIVSWDLRVRADRVAGARRLIERSSIEEGLREAILARLPA